MLNQITPMILTCNEADNIGRTLQHLRWANDILIVDSFSTDNTLEIAQQYRAVRIVQRQFDTFAHQCNFGLSQISSEWVLSLDADYILSNELITELGRLHAVAGIDGYDATFTYCIFGRPLRRSLYPPRTVLYRRSSARYCDHGHGHRVSVAGPIQRLCGVIFHDDRKPLTRWLNAQIRYAQVEARQLQDTPATLLSRADRVRRYIVLAPMLVPLYTLLGKALILDGWPGWYYTIQRVHAELLLSLTLLDLRLRAVVGSASVTDSVGQPGSPTARTLDDCSEDSAVP